MSDATHRSSASVALRSGVTVSFVLLTAGVVRSIGAGPAGPLRPQNFSDTLAGVIRFEAAPLIHVGLLVLLLTPFARVVALVLEFARERDRTFVAVSFGVLFLLITTIMIGMWGESR